MRLHNCERLTEIGVLCRAEPIVRDGLCVGGHHAGVADLFHPQFMSVEGSRGYAVRTDPGLESQVEQAPGGLSNADVSFQADDHDLSAAARPQRLEAPRAAVDTEIHFREYARKIQFRTQEAKCLAHPLGILFGCKYGNMEQSGHTYEKVNSIYRSLRLMNERNQAGLHVYH